MVPLQLEGVGRNGLAFQPGMQQSALISHLPQIRNCFIAIDFNRLVPKYAQRHHRCAGCEYTFNTLRLPGVHACCNFFVDE
jgi:hypothetical protein